MIYWELKKIVKSKTGIIATVIFIVLCATMACLTPEMETENSYRNEQYELIRDIRPGEVIAQEKLDHKIATITEMATNQQEDDFSKGIKAISSKKLNSMEDTHYQGIDFWKVYDYRATHAGMAFCIVIIIIIVCCNIYTDEINSTVENLILTAKNKNKVLYSKLGFGILLPIVMYAGYLGIQFIVTAIQYGMPLHGELQGLRIIDNPGLLREAYTIIELITIKISIMLLVLVTLGVNACLCSFTTTSSIASTSRFVIFIIIAKVLTLLKILPSSVRMVLENINFINLLFYFNQFAGMYYGNIRLLGMNVDVMNFCLVMLGFTSIAAITLSMVAFQKVVVR